MTKKRLLSILICCTIVITLVSQSFVAFAASLQWPVPGHTSLSRGWYYYDADNNHCGIDITDGSIYRAEVFAAMSGTVWHKYTCEVQHPDGPGDHGCKGLGTGLVIRGTDGRFYSYGHMCPQSIPASIQEGSYVEMGTKIGEVGTTGYSTGYHLHFAIGESDNWWDAYINPWYESYVYDRPHSHNHSNYVYNWAAHPHYKCYACATCGDVKENRNEPTYSADCAECNPIGTPFVSVSALEYTTEENVVFTWNSTANANLYKLSVYDAESNSICFGYPVNVTELTYTDNFAAGNYYATLTAVNTKFDTRATSGNCTFSVEDVQPEEDTVVVNFDANGGSDAPVAQSYDAAANGWTDTKNENQTALEEKTQYRFSKKQTMSGTPGSGSSQDNWTDWSAWSTTPISETENIEVEAKWISAQYKTQYNYSRWISNAGQNTGPSRGNWGGVECNNYQELGWSDRSLEIWTTNQGFNIYRTAGTDAWYNEITRQVETAAGYTMYRSRTKLPKTPEETTQNGWIKYDTELTGWTEWSAWSNAAVSETDDRQVESRWIAPQTKTQYNYSRWISASGQNTGPSQGNWGGVECSYYQELGWSDNALGIWSTNQGFNIYWQDGSGAWYNQTTRQVETAPGYTQYRYRTAVYTDLYYRWTAWSKFSDTVVTEDENTQVETRKMYRYESGIYIPTQEPVRAGFDFLGWSTDKTAENAAFVANQLYTPSENTTLYAVWECRHENIVTDPAVAATCSKPGKTQGSHCAACDKVIVAQTQTELAPHTWNSGFVTKPVTCVSEGVRTYSCTACNETKTEAIAVIEHTPATAIRENEIAATCAKEGSYDEVVLCSMCGTELSRTAKTIAKLSHTSSGWMIDSQATCTAEGTQHKECTKCYAVLENGTIAKVSHTPSDWIIDAPATCAAVGTRHKSCTVCGAVTVREAISKLAHTPVTVLGIAATCSLTGLTDGAKCSVCGTVITEQTTIPATGNHEDFDGDGECDECGEKVAPSTPSDENCSHICHKGGFAGFIYKILRFFWKLFGINKTCACGASHY